MLLTRQNTRWRGTRLAMAVAVAATISGALLAPARPAFLLVSLAGVAIGGAGVQLRLALQHDSIFDYSRRLRLIAATLSVIGATATGVGLALFVIRGAS